MRLLLLIGFLLLLASAARAQDTLAVVRPAALAPVAITADTVAADTVAALHRLFAHKRGARTRAVLITLGAGALLAGITASTDDGRNYASVKAVALGVLAIPVVLSELLYYGQYTRRRERLAIQDFQAHHLSTSLQQKLEARYFQPANP